MSVSLGKVAKMLELGGHLLICDFFRLEVPEKSLMGGGHRWEAFKKIIENTKLDLVSDNNITKGNEKVLRARFSDAKFFVECDKKVSSIERNEKLKSVSYLNIC